MQHRPSEETEPVIATVDHADIRGLGTTLLVSVGCLPRSRSEGLLQPRNAVEGCTVTGAASLPMICASLLLTVRTRVCDRVLGCIRAPGEKLKRECHASSPATQAVARMSPGALRFSRGSEKPTA